jgi:hypothetical protein
MKKRVLGKWNDAFKEKRIKEHIIFPYPVFQHSTIPSFHAAYAS